MNDVALPVDHHERERALDPQQSFIVQAPAGSGKTHLLIQRFLRLLACVDEPEQIIAITFTVKAAGEMRERVLNALEKARNGVAPEAPHEVSMAELATAAVNRDRERGWGLAEFPARLRVTTIDALNRQLSSSAPLIAGGFALNSMAGDNAGPLYREAANRLLNWMEDDGPVGNAVKAVLAHLDNNVGQFIRLIAQMLAKREQWLPILGAGALTADSELNEQRAELEACLEEIIVDRLERVQGLLPLNIAQELPALAQFAANNLDAVAKPAVQIECWRERDGLPDALAFELECWQELAGLLLTKDNTWRKSRGITKTIGFPAQTAEKHAFIELLIDLQASDPDDQLRLALAEVRQLPSATIDDGQWSILEHLLVVLPLSVVELRNVFRERGEADFSEVAIEAQTALGRSDEPSDLALAMDCKLQHILLDEFQDTSVSQYELLRMLIRGWVPGDGRSLFLVGDPMQSIYRFRQAEVSNFLEVAEQGIATGEGYWFRPEPLQLKANFRSAPAVIDWVNQAFEQILPAEDDALTGAVKFSASVASKPAVADSGVFWKVMPDDSFETEAAQVVGLIETILTAGNGEETVGVLVRSRSHASGIANLLRSRGIPFAGKGLEYMADIPLVQDLLSLTRAVLHPLDRLAWTAVLRAPWCGLMLEDLHSLLAFDRKAAVWSLLPDATVQERLSADGVARVSRLIDVLQAGFERRGCMPLCDWIEGLWLALGGPAAAREAGELKAAQAYFRLLEAETDADDIPDTASLLASLKAEPVSFSSADASVQIMTMHKAKGLEFDHVVLPSLGRRTRPTDKEVLGWKQILRPDGSPGLLLAPIEATGDGPDPLFRFISGIDQAQEIAERSRLLYVAATRARRCLYPCVYLKADKKGELAGWVSSSLAACMEPVMRSELTVPAAAEEGAEEVDANWQQPDLRRFSTDWRPPRPAVAVQAATRHPIEQPAEPITFDWASPLAREVGTVVHAYLEQMSVQGVDAVAYPEAVCRAMLAEQGVTGAELRAGVERVRAALDNAVNDEQARWVLDAGHSESASELAIAVTVDGRTQKKIIDRTFVSNDGERWIVDYKTSVHRGSDTEAFIDNEVVRYREQLEGYKAAIKDVYPDQNYPVRLALYFPGLRVFREVV